MSEHGLGRLTDRNGTPVALDLRRVRKTVKSHQYLRAGGVLEDFASGHTRPVAAKHYADIGAHEEIHEQAVEAGLSQALGIALAPPVVLSDDGAWLDEGRAALTAREIESALTGKQDVWLASCRDFFASPFARKPGAACPVPAWGCLECPNAAFTSRHLPSLLSFLDFLERQREEYPAAEWTARFGLAWDRIVHGVRARFSTRQIATAHTIGRRRPTVPAPIVPGGHRMTAVSKPRSDHRELPSSEEYVLPERLTLRRPSRGPLLFEDVWDLRCVLPRTWLSWRLDFSQIVDPVTRRTAKEYVASRLRRGSLGLRPLKATAAAAELRTFITVVRDLQEAGALLLSDLDRAHLDAVVMKWKNSPHTAVRNVTLLKHLAAHGPFLSEDRLSVLPWNGRSAYGIAGVQRVKGENATPRIPEEVLTPLLQAAVFYVEKAGGDILTAQREIAALEAARMGRSLGHGQARERVLTFMANRRAAGRGIPAVPREAAHTVPNAVAVDGVLQTPNHSLVSLLAGCGKAEHLCPLLVEAGEDIGYEEGGLDTPMSVWPGSGRPWRPRLSPFTLANELSFLRTACWIVITYLSGMRDTENGAELHLMQHSAGSK
jgi:hypothetical protein